MPKNELLQEAINASAPAAERFSGSGRMDPLDQTAADHEAYAASRRGLYIGREEYAAQLIAHVEGDGPPLVVTGDPGSGKSALLANWAHFWSQRHPQTPVLMHFIGAAPDTAGWMQMLRRFLGEFRRTFSVAIDIPHDPYALRVAFANALHMVAARARLVLIVDGLDQLEDSPGALDLDWLPPVIPSNVRLILSTLSDRPWAELKRRAWPLLTVRHLNRDEREQLAAASQARHEKALDNASLKRILDERATSNPLYLLTLLNELRTAGMHPGPDECEGFEDRLAWYLDAKNPLELYGKAMRRWERDCVARSPLSQDLAGEALTRIWAARRGLSQTELLESIGSASAPFPVALLAPLLADMGDNLVRRGGLITFAHPLLREAVRKAYLPKQEDRQAAHLTLATYFYGQRKSRRQFEELPWQWQQAGEWNSLSFLLAQPSFLAALWKADQTEVKTFWTEIEANSPLRMETVYAPAIRKLTADPEHAARIGDLLSAMGRSQAELRVRSGLVKHLRGVDDGQVGDRAGLATALGAQAAILRMREDLKGALALYLEQELLCRQLLGESRSGAVSSETARGLKQGLQTSVAGVAAILYAQGYLEPALVNYKQQERLCRELNYDKGLSSALGGQASILYARGDVKGALTLLEEYEKTCRERGDRYGQAASLGNQALIVKDHGDLDKALALLGSQERLYRTLGHQPGISNSLGNQATIFSDRGDLAGAMARLKEQERICRAVDHQDGLAISLANQAVVHIAAKRLAEARFAVEMALTIATRHHLQQIIPGIQRIRDAITSDRQA